MIAKQLQYIQHWKAEYMSYDDIPNEKATWHIDPPYKVAGKRYRKNKIDYVYLAKWCRNRKGQVMVCEQKGADWLPFKRLRTNNNGSNKQYTEMVWYNKYFHPI